MELFNNMENKHQIYNELNKLKDKHELIKRNIINHIDNITIIENEIFDLENELLEIERQFVILIDKITNEE